MSRRRRGPLVRTRGGGRRSGRRRTEVRRDGGAVVPGGGRGRGGNRVVREGNRQVHGRDGHSAHGHADKEPGKGRPEGTPAKSSPRAGIPVVAAARTAGLVQAGVTRRPERGAGARLGRTARHVLGSPARHAPAAVRRRPRRILQALVPMLVGHPVTSLFR
ncbi:hypothetical protein [Streptomyces zaomyceticus]|uniref:hypothetical protein n=1 Tax=Streptomyces zaomyceticus TaxID=68286 RepID=UPI002E130D28|nr:hypothetical protein OG237_38525 [Streptomyces zaomyceticus]